ncbi:MAG: class I SAM-dependent methyltransferase, partial [Vicinamibacterales bacterium]
HDLIAMRGRLTELAVRWAATEPRVFVYGIGTHTRRLLAICPELGRFIGGFIDRRAGESFLGRPCVTPDAFTREMADVVLYSSREFEQEMYARLLPVPVEHVLLYRPSPPAPEATTAARLTGRFGVAVDQSGLEAIYHPPAWATGYVSGSDAAFLHHMVAAHRPRTVVELGVASGASSAALLYALDQLPGNETRTLYSCDVRTTCYFDERYETGQACRQMYPSPRTTWRREFTTDARALRQLLPPGGADLTFIDANHSHPWPLLDLLHLTAVARPGSWVILHDVDLPIQHPEHQVYGPRWLFQHWPFNKVKGVGPWTSIAAVQLPLDPSQLVPMALALLDQPWEQAPSPDQAALPAAFAAVRDTLEARLGLAPALATR